MTQLQLDRRRLLKLGLSASAIAALASACGRVPQPSIDRLLTQSNDGPQPAEPDVTGVLDAAEFDTLGGLCRFVDTYWELQADVPAYLAQLRMDLELKTGRPPSYLTEYRRALELVEIVNTESDSLDTTWTSLLFADFGSNDAADTWIARARRLVFSEIIAHQVPISSGFRSFGLRNYRGYFGGPYSLPASYRRGAV